MSFLRRWLTLLVPLLLAACMLGPDYRPPTPPPGATGPLMPAAPGTTDAEPPADWWRLYDDPALDGLIAQAFAANEDLKTAEANLAASRAILETARAALVPQSGTSFGATYGRNPTTDEILELSGRKPVTGWSFDSLLDVSYELDLFGHIRRSIEAARDNAEATAAARDALRVTIAAETARAYGQVCTVGEQLAVAQRSAALARQQEQIVQRKRDAGAGSDFDVTRAQVVVSQQEASIPPLEGARQSAVYELAALLGQTPAYAPVSVARCVTPPRLNVAMPVGDGASLLRRRPDIREADRELAASLAQIGVAEADFFPRFTLSGFYGGASSQINMLGSNNGLAWGVGPAISWSFPNFQIPVARLAQAHASAAAALSGFDSTVLQALKETAQALTVYQAEFGTHAALINAQTEARQAFAQANDQFNAGMISNLDVLTSEQTLIGADAAVAASDAALVQDQIAVFKALGGGWETN